MGKRDSFQGFVPAVLATAAAVIVFWLMFWSNPAERVVAAIAAIALAAAAYGAMAGKKQEAKKK